MPEIGAALINPDAGSHPVTTDPREVAASVAAGDRSWREFPYYQARFGDRGRRFGHSDSAWLSLIALKEQPQVNAEVRWLGELLASRGMPQWLLERHLEFLHEELAAAVPENREQYGRLLNAAGMLRNQRRAQIREQDFLALAADFRARAGAEWTARLPNMGPLLVSAVADEAAGISQAVPQLESWATDPSRFPAEWIAAVHDTIQAARARVSAV
ncbi:hypothetical protein [Longimicrobium sp.]|uniref:hypothetical protein n=1 Tax=Longimicrobium sp. TaxID=2029185 RepID=UPI002CF79288|nr:hypothetical protein [Longimicrobium sp.]HSU13380.1 hypothetical protein [Longimicrobium sp.]